MIFFISRAILVTASYTGYGNIPGLKPVISRFVQRFYNYRLQMPSLFIHRLPTIALLMIMCVGFSLTSCSLGKIDADKSTLTPEKRYQQTKADLIQLESTPINGDIRENWLPIAQDFRKIYLADPKSEYAPNCLFMLGKTYNRMFTRFNNKLDLDEAISYYTDLFTLFPENKLADDALWIVANIYLDNLHDTKKAIEFLTKIATDYPNGDMLSQATRELKTLTKDQNFGSAQNSSGSQPTKLITVLPVKYWSSNDYSRVVINASGPVSFKEQLLEQMGDQPRRLYIDFYNSYIEPQYRSPVPIEDGLLKRIRTGQYTSDTVRVVLDIESISSYQVFSLPDPFRVVVDVRGQVKEGSSPSPNSTAPTPPEQQQITVAENPPSDIIVLRDKRKYKPSQDQKGEAASQPVLALQEPQRQEKAPPGTTGKPITLAQQLGLRVKKIVLDPGHGGKDPGAMAFDLKEKDIVLKVAQKLGPILEKKLGCKVILTRNNDVFISLEERTAIANANDADLFVSLHTNASASDKAYGTETYFLNLTTNPEAMRVAAFENATSTHQMSDLQNILSNILKNSKITESSRLAQRVHNSMITGLEKNFSHIKSLGVKQAPFYVLIGAQMPAILIEMAFISNQNDAQHLKSDKFIDRMANEISAGIQSYVHTNTARL